MTDATRLLNSVTLDVPVDGTQLAETIDALRSCALACTTCADACLGEDDATEMRSCVRACTTCGEICDAHGAVHKHCRLCEEACRRCEQAIQQLLAKLAAVVV